MEPITAEELEFIQTWYNPIALSECIFSDADNMALFNEEKSIQIRLGQYPLLSYEYFVDTNIPNLSNKEKHALREGAGNIYCYAARLFGKCEWINNDCILANGKIVKFKELIGKTENILALDENTWKLVKTPAQFFDNGIKRCYKLKTKSGKQIIVTENHPFLTDNGWKKIQELKVSDWVATPRDYGELGSEEVDENIPKILGYLLGDGTCSNISVGFTNINPEIIKEFKELVSYFNCDVWKNNITYWIKKKDNYRRKAYIKKIGYIPGEGNKPNIIKRLLIEYKANKLSKNKEIPQEVFGWKNKYIAILLNRLFACDGTVNKGNSTIEICLSSQKMIYQIQNLLLRFGIHSNIYFKTVHLNGKIFPAWRLCICKDNLKFMLLIGIVSKEEKFWKYYKNKKIPQGDEIPNRFIDLVYDCFEGSKYTLKLRNYKLYNVSREQWQKLTIYTSNKLVHKIAKSDIYWEQISEIIDVGEAPTVMVSVPKYHNYCSNDFISHNSFCGEKIDIIQEILCGENEDCGFSSFDMMHIQGILESIVQVLNFHHIVSLFKNSIQKSPMYLITTKTGVSITSVNQNVADGKRAGDQFYQKHFKKHWMEEAGQETQIVYEKAAESRSEIGCVERFLGMANYTRHSAPGKITEEAVKRGQFLNLPSYCNPNYDSNDEQRAIKKYGGKQSIGFRTFIEGEVIEDGISALDMTRIRELCYPHKKDGSLDDTATIKNFEVDNKTFLTYRGRIIVERPKNCDRLVIASDVGRIGGTTEIIVMVETNGMWKYLYNVTLRNLGQKQQYQIFKYIYQRLNPDYLACDITDGTGDAIIEDLSNDPEIDKKRLIRVGFNQNVEVGIETNEKGEPIKENGQFIKKFQNTTIWSTERLCYLLYEPKIQLALDYKLDEQLNSVIAIPRGTSISYHCAATEDHLFQAFQVFAIVQWKIEYEGFSRKSSSAFAKKHCKEGV